MQVSSGWYVCVHVCVCVRMHMYVCVRMRMYVCAHALVCVLSVLGWVSCSVQIWTERVSRRKRLRGIWGCRAVGLGKVSEGSTI